MTETKPKRERETGTAPDKEESESDAAGDYELGPEGMLQIIEDVEAILKRAKKAHANVVRFSGEEFDDEPQKVMTAAYQFREFIDEIKDAIEVYQEEMDDPER